MAARLGHVCRQARIDAGVTALRIAQAAGVTESVISTFERGSGWRRRTDEIVEAYEAECGLLAGELWKRAVG